jgi:hypothetical protein
MKLATALFCGSLGAQQLTETLSELRSLMAE